MPRRAKKFCPTLGCNALVTTGHCLSCIKTTRQHQDRERGTAASRGYGANWRKLRRMKLNAEPLCECGCEQPAELVHHRDGNASNNLWDNLMSMAAGCHLRLHAKGGERWQSHRKAQT